MKKLIYTLVILVFAISLNAQWVQMSNGMMGNKYINSLAFNGNNIFAGTFGGSIYDGVYLSTNNGTSWTVTSLSNHDAYALLVSGNKIFAGSYGIYSSTNNGVTWDYININQAAHSLAANLNYVFAGSNGGGVYVSTNNGSTWTQTSFNTKFIRSLAVNGSNVYAGTDTNGVYLSTNNGTTWSQSSLNSLRVFALAVNGNYVFAGTSNRLYISSNNGSTWVLANFGANNESIYSIALYGNKVIVGTGDKNVFVSQDNGVTWTKRNEGLGNFHFMAFCILNNFIFGGSDGLSVYRRPLSEIIGIQNISTEVPSAYSLGQNYPNPFNPTTKIKFQVKSAGVVKLVVLDILGKEVAALVNEKLQPGTYETTFDASAYPSGAYFYRIKIENFTDVKRMVLVK